MKVIPKSEFLQLPAGVLFRRLERDGYVGPLSRKGETCMGDPPSDFFLLELGDISTSLRNQPYNASALQMETAEVRECLYDDTTRYAVFTETDLYRLECVLQHAIPA